LIILIIKLITAASNTKCIKSPKPYIKKPIAQIIKNSIAKPYSILDIINCITYSKIYCFSKALDSLLETNIVLVLALARTALV